MNQTPMKRFKPIPKIEKITEETLTQWRNEENAIKDKISSLSETELIYWQQEINERYARALAETKREEVKLTLTQSVKGSMTRETNEGKDRISIESADKESINMNTEPLSKDCITQMRIWVIKFNNENWKSKQFAIGLAEDY